MSVDHQVSNEQASSTWTEPPWSGWIETTGDALLILEAARRGLIPRVTRRLVDSERKMITSGSVFVFDEVESGIKRWSDDFLWSPRRILGNFFLYRETERLIRGAGYRSARLDNDTDDDDSKAEGILLSRPKTDNASMGVNKHKERTLVGSLTNSYNFKPAKRDGLMKKVSFLGFSSNNSNRVTMILDFFFDYWQRLPACNFILQDKRCREWSSPVSLFPPRAGFPRYQPGVSR